MNIKNIFCKSEINIYS